MSRKPQPTVQNKPTAKRQNRARRNKAAPSKHENILPFFFLQIKSRSTTWHRLRKMSCNGCRALRKGCGDSCVLRPSLGWIAGHQAQVNATLFVARFFGRSDLLVFLSAVPDDQKSALFQSLLFEACGRTVNPVSGAVGLLWMGNWHLCKAAVDTVLGGRTPQPLQECFVTSWNSLLPIANKDHKTKPSTSLMGIGRQRRATKSTKPFSLSQLSSGSLTNNDDLRERSELKVLNLFV